MTRWQSDLYFTRYTDRHIDLRLEVEASKIPRSTAWYWRVIDEEGDVVRDGSGETPQHAKAACMRAAKRYAKRPHK